MAEGSSQHNGKSLDAGQIIDRTRQYIMENFLYTRPDFVIDPADSLLERRIVDSVGMVELLGFIEETFGLHAADDEVTEDNFATLERIARYVLRKREKAAA